MINFWGKVFSCTFSFQQLDLFFPQLNFLHQKRTAGKSCCPFYHFKKKNKGNHIALPASCAPIPDHADGRRKGPTGSTERCFCPLRVTPALNTGHSRQPAKSAAERFLLCTGRYKAFSCSKRNLSLSGTAYSGPFFGGLTELGYPFVQRNHGSK